jgi:hypothetical protein
MARDIIDYWKMCRIYASKRRPRGFEADDFSSYCVIRKLEGRDAKLNWMWVDFLRLTLGDPRGANEVNTRLRTLFQRPVSLEEELSRKNIKGINNPLANNHPYFE